MLDLMHHVEALTREIGPRRPAGSGAEQRAATYAATQARRYAYHVWVDPVRIAARPWLVVLLIGAFALLGLSLMTWSVWVGALLLLVAAATWGLYVLGRLNLKRFAKERPSQNVVAVMPPRLAVRDRLVVVVPVDTPCAGLGGRADTAEEDPGAGAIAVALGLGRFLRRAPLNYTEVWTVFAGGQFAGDMGLRTLLDVHQRTLSEAYIILLTGVGGGSLRYVTGEGAPAPQPDERDLLTLVRSVAQQRPALGIKATSGAPFSHHMGAVAGPRSIAMRSDASEIDPVTLSTAWRFLYEIADRLDRQAQVEVVAEQVLADGEEAE